MFQGEYLREGTDDFRVMNGQENLTVLLYIGLKVVDEVIQAPGGQSHVGFIHGDNVGA